ncbi:hypothetical protein TeGR_g13417, partial [Tetraparma gracilis]
MPKSPPSVFRAGLFEGSVILVTGGGTGIGYAIAAEFASLGGTVVIASRSMEKLSVAVDKARAELGVTMHAREISLRDEASIEACVESIVAEHGKIDVLVNNAGGQFPTPAENLTRNGFKAVVDLNLLGTFMVSKAVYNATMRDTGGSIVNITLGNRNGMPTMAHSGAARAGVENMARTMAAEWVSDGVRVNCVRPGIIYTESGFANYGDVGETMMAKILPSLP